MDKQTTRRNALGSLGVGAVAFLAACSQDNSNAGITGQPSPTTETPPTVPPTVPSQTQLKTQDDELKTLVSLELAMVEIYKKYGSKLKDAEWKSAVRSFSSKHSSNADEIEKEIESGKSEGANKYVMDSMVKPMENLLTNDSAILAFFSKMESTLTATYIQATGVMTTAELRQVAASWAAEAAKRSAALADRGRGQATSAPLYPMDDLVSQEAFVGGEEEDN